MLRHKRSRTWGIIVYSMTPHAVYRCSNAHGMNVLLQVHLVAYRGFCNLEVPFLACFLPIFACDK